MQNNLQTVNTTAEIQENQTKQHPIKNSIFFGIPRHVALMPSVTDRLFRLLSILCSSFGDDGHMEFRVATLAKLMGNKSERATRRIIDEAEKAGLIKTYQTGRSLGFELTEIFFGNKIVRLENTKNDHSQNSPTKNGHSERTKMATLYHLEKKEKKESTESPQIPPENESPSLPESDIDCVRKLLRKKLLYQVKDLNRKIEASIEKNGLEYTKWAATEAKSAGYFVDAINNREKYRKFDRKIVTEGESTAIEESQKHFQDINKLALLCKDRQYLTRTTSAEIEPVKAKKELAFNEQRVLFLEYVRGIDEHLYERFKDYSEYQLQNSREFKSYVNIQNN